MSKVMPKVLPEMMPAPVCTVIFTLICPPDLHADLSPYLRGLSHVEKAAQ